MDAKLSSSVLASLARWGRCTGAGAEASLRLLTTTEFFCDAGEKLVAKNLFAHRAEPASVSTG